MKTLLYSLSVCAALSASSAFAASYASWGPEGAKSQNWSDPTIWNRYDASGGTDWTDIADPDDRKVPENDGTSMIKLQSTTVNVDMDVDILGFYSSYGAILNVLDGKTLTIANGYSSDGLNSELNILGTGAVLASGNVDTGWGASISVKGTDNDNRAAITAANITASGGDDNFGTFTAEYADLTGKFNAQRKSVVTWNHVTLNGDLEAQEGSSAYTNSFSASNSVVNGRVFSNNYGSLSFKDSTISAASGGADFNKGSTIVLDGTSATYSDGGVSVKNTGNSSDAPDIAATLTIKNGSTL